jgi:hypothetical protein
MSFAVLDFCYACIDDVLVDSTSEVEHLCTLFQRFSKCGVLLNLEKYVFGGTEMTSLGYTASAEGTRPLEEKVAALNRFQQPIYLKDLTFLWHA